MLIPLLRKVKVKAHFWSRLRRVLPRLALLAVLGSAPGAFAGGSSLDASLDRQAISEDESVSLRVRIRVEGSGSIGDVSYQAPDFEVINRFDSSHIESFYENGAFGIRNNRVQTFVLRPRRTGKLSISGIQAVVDGDRLTAPPLSVEVGPGGAGTPPPSRYGGAGAGLRGAGKSAPTPGRRILVRAEVNKDRVFKGEELIVSYYLYRQVRVLNVQVDQYPQLGGFLREDLEMPVLSPQLTTERVLLDGAEYERSLLVRYSASPLKTGKLRLDPMRLRATYQDGRAAMPGFGFGDDEDDVFRPFMNFFGQMTPTTATVASEPVSIEVLPLPDGKPADFSGAVGRFAIEASVDRARAGVGEPIELTVRIEGRGGLAAIERPKLALPAELELYDSKDWSKGAKSGPGERFFRLTLMPRKEGRTTIPPIGFSFFDPDTQAYERVETTPLELEIFPGGTASVGSGGSPAGSLGDRGRDNEQATTLPQPFLAPEKLASSQGFARVFSPWFARLTTLLALFSVLGLAAWIGLDVRRSGRSGARRPPRWVSPVDWERLELLARRAGSPSGLEPAEIQRAYENLQEGLFASLDQALSAVWAESSASPSSATAAGLAQLPNPAQMPARTLPAQAPKTRGLAPSELEALVAEDLVSGLGRGLGLGPELWRELSAVLDAARAARFAGGASGPESASRLFEWVRRSRELENRWATRAEGRGLVHPGAKPGRHSALTAQNSDDGEPSFRL